MRPIATPLVHLMATLVSLTQGESASHSNSSRAQENQLVKTESPLLGYIFDAHSNQKHHHHDHPWGPHFEETNVTTVTVRAGSTVYLDCRISLLQDKMVSWVRRKEDDLQLLTVGHHTYSSDSRYSMDFQYPSNWRLKITYANKRDEGLYECQISTHPPKVNQVQLLINAPQVRVVNDRGEDVFEKYYKAGSTIELTCHVQYASMASSYVIWHHGDYTLNYDTIRGGISVKTDLKEDGAVSKLLVARVQKADSGNYTCSISPKDVAVVTVHVLNGEHPAGLQHGGAPHLACLRMVLLLLCSIFATTVR